MLKIRSPFRAKVRRICLQPHCQGWGSSALTQSHYISSIHLGCLGLSPGYSERWREPVQTWSSLIYLCVTNSQKSCVFCPYAQICGRLRVQFISERKYQSLHCSPSGQTFVNCFACHHVPCFAHIVSLNTLWDTYYPLYSDAKIKFLDKLLTGLSDMVCSSWVNQIPQDCGRLHLVTWTKHITYLGPIHEAADLFTSAFYTLLPLGISCFKCQSLKLG